MKKPTAKTVEEVNIYLEGLSVRIPDTSTDNTLVRFDGAAGAMQGTSVTVDDSNNLTTAGAIVAGNGASTSQHITVNAAKDTANADVGFRASGTNRWTIRRTADTESGSGAGSHLAIIRRDDSGTAISPNAVQIYRDTGKIMVGSVGATAGIEMGSSGPRVMVGTGSPEGAVTAPPGSVWRQTDDSTLTYLRWYKATGTGNTGWLPDFEGRFKTFTPTLKDSTGSTLSGWTCTGRYTIRGKWATCIVDILASSPSAGTGEYRIYLPSDAQAATASPVRWCVEGSLIAFDNSSGNLGWMRVNVANAAYVTAWSPATWPYSNGQYQLSATVPNFTWAANDRINGTFSYEIA